ncbi:MAG TPA: PaaI family thioesterase [Rhizomicrobium sp.]|jgi:acyl-coenzyme A thioesterase PaaI-like protein|nr:PaaI family thioesterase [Rhizomicrobium sp.]
MTDAVTQIPPDAEPIGTVGFNVHAGPIYRLADEGELLRYAFLPEQKHMNGSGAVHGGMLMTFADVSMSRTARLAFEGNGCNTVALSCDFVSPGKLGELIESRVRITRKTRTMAFISAEVVSGGRPLLIATGLWKVAGK